MVANKLKPGSTIGLVAPCHLAGAARYSRFIEGIRALGYRVKESERLYWATYGYAASEIERAQDINDMATDAEIDMIMFGGGDIGNEPLPYIDYAAIKAHPKLYTSYSNGTSILSAIYAQTGLEVYYGANPGEFEDISLYDFRHFERAFIDAKCDSFYKYSPWSALAPGACEGKLIGGYAGLLPALIMNKYCAWDMHTDYILFMEDMEKFCSPSVVAQNLAFIEQSPYIERVKGLLFGYFSDNESLELIQILKRFGERYSIPVVKCNDFGHGRLHGILPIGRAARLDADKLTLEYR